MNTGIELLKALGEGILLSIPNLIPTMIEAIITLCDTITNNLETVIEVAMEIIFAIIDGLIQALPTLIEEVPRIINTFCDKIYSLLPLLLAKGVEMLLEIGKGLIQALPTFIANIPQILMAILNVWTLFNWANMGSSAINWIKDGITSLKETLPNLLKQIGTNALNWLKTTFTQGTGVGSGLITNIISGVSSVVSSLLSILGTMASNCLSTIKGYLSWDKLVNIGKDLVRGIWNGISSMGGWLLDMVSSFASSIIDSITSMFDINSPSRVMRDLVGKNIVRGIGVGVDVETPNLKKDLEANMGELIYSMSSTVDREASSYGAIGLGGATDSKTINNDNGITQNITIVSPERTPSENARAIKQMSRRLVYG